MIVFGPQEALIYRKNMVVFNFTSLKEGFEMIKLVPTQNLAYGDERMFDQNYANYILGNDAVFIELMKMMLPIFNGLDVYIMVHHIPNFEFLHDSLQKFIQQRYGYVSNVIYSIEDWECVIDSQFSLQGIYNFDRDKERLLVLYSQTIGVDKMMNSVQE